MATSKLRRRLAVATASVVVGISGLGLVSGSSPAGADPKQLDKTNFVGVGSDTSQEIVNAFSGFSAGKMYDPLQSDGGLKQILSFDALFNNNGTLVGNTCIEPRTGFAPMYRPNGSTEGRRALSRAFGGGTYGIAACGIRSPSGLVDFARSSSGPAAGDAGTDLTYIPYARDGVSYALYKPTVGASLAVTDISTAVLTTLHQTGPLALGPSNTVVVACGIQTGSGTYSFWMGRFGLTASPPGDATGTALCNSLRQAGDPFDTDGRIEENKSNQLKLKGDLLQAVNDPACDGVPGGAAVSCAGTEVIVGFSASAWIAAGNGVSPTTLSTGVSMGTITNIPVAGAGQSPVLGTAPTLTANSAYYNNATFGRNIYNVLPTESVNDIGNVPLQSMFVGATSKICQTVAQSRVTTFGFLTLGAGTCGTTTLKGSFIAGQV
jgi:hypothetical protein